MGTIFDQLQNLISVDIEAAGSIPSRFALLSIGACTLTRPQQTFYVELQPDQDQFDPQALEVHGLDPEQLRQKGLPPEEAMRRFADWLKNTLPPGEKPIMLAFNAPFDWMFINDYFIRYLGENPFGHNAIDIKAVYLGATGKSWQETSGVYLHARYHDGSRLTHNALDDAIAQADIFEGILREIQGNLQAIHRSDFPESSLSQ
jgi:DNA polymerase III epsilon subunit-like protein